jgi:hypothetical protein
MSNLVFEPYAAEQRWQMPAPLPGQAWQELLAQYLAALTRACTGAGPCIIGHLKALALFPAGGYLRASAISAQHPPTVDGRAPDGLQALDLTLNLLVYGLPHTALERIATEEAATLAAQRGGQVDTHTAAHHHPPGEHPATGGR